MSQTTSTAPDPRPASSAEEHPNVTANRIQGIGLCAAGLLISFFLPWINFLGMHRSLFDAAKRGGTNLLYWSLPIFSALTIFAGLTKRSPKIVAQLAGAIPFVILGQALFEHGSDFMRILDFGAYVGLTLGLVLFILPRSLK